MIKGNKGEWSELYVLFKLLGDRQLFSGEELFYPIIKIIRNESGGDFEYKLDGNLVTISGGKEELRMPAKDFADQASKLVVKIKASSEASFSIPEIETFMGSINCQTLKSESTSKTDIRIVIYDKRVHQTAELGFSIKSQLGAKATLFNAGKATNFIYQLNGFKGNQDEIKKINTIKTIKDRIKKIKELGGELKFKTLENDTFKNNLTLIDSFLPAILAEILKTSFTPVAGLSSKKCSIKALTEEIHRNNPLNYETEFGHRFYEYKIRRFLTDVALGMTPSKVWTGVYDATGGYLVVTKNGDILCYDIYNSNQFADYLFNNTKLDTASTNRYDFGKIYQEKKDGNWYFKLNLQIRFV